MASVNRIDQDEPAQVGKGDQEMKVLKEMSELQSDHYEFVKSLAPRVDVHDRGV